MLIHLLRKTKTAKNQKIYSVMNTLGGLEQNTELKTKSGNFKYSYLGTKTIC